MSFREQNIRAPEENACTAGYTLHQYNTDITLLYTCQLSRIMSESRACGLKILISRITAIINKNPIQFPR